MNNFEVQVTLGSPIALGHLPYGPTLDSVLMALLAGPGGPSEWQPDPSDRLPELVEVRDGVPSASALWPESTPAVSLEVHPRVSSNDEIWYWTGKTARADSGPYITKVTNLRLTHERRWRWWARGDMDAVAELLGSLDSLGARRGSGYGAVSRISISQMADDEPVWVAQWAEDQEHYWLSRPVPKDRLSDWLDNGGLTPSDLDMGRHALVPLAQWPAPPRSGSNPVPTWMPIAFF